MSRFLQQRDDIQGLRAIAVIFVMLFHLNKDLLPGGFIGVDIFFVISGYLITSLILKRREQGTFSFVSFYLARCRRIVPAYMVTLLATALVMTIFLVPRDFSSFLQSLLSASYFNSNTFFSSQSDYFAPQAYELPLLHTWSLAVEMQFYLLLPAILVFTKKRYILPVLSFVLILCFSYSVFLLADGERQRMYFSLIARIPEFLVGGIVAMFIIRGAAIPRFKELLAALGLFLICLSAFFINEDDAFPGILAVPVCVGVAFLIYARDSFVNKVLSCSLLVWVGALSYSLYLWHWPILSSFRYFLNSYDLPAYSAVVAMVVTVCVSYLSYAFVETPLRRNWGRKKVYLIGCSVALLAFFVSFGGYVNKTLVPSLPTEYARYADPDKICHGKIVGNCMHGDMTSPITILLIGDSHAAQLNKFSDIVGAETKTKIRVVTGSSCVPIDGFDSVRIKEWAREPCEDQIKRVRDYIKSADAVVIAGMWAFHADSELFMTAYDRFLKMLSDRNIPTLVMMQVPELNANVQRVYRFNYLGLDRNVEKKSDVDRWNAKITAASNVYPNVSFLDLSGDDLFLSAPLRDGKFIYFDSHHLNEVGSEIYGHVAVPYFLEWLESIKVQK